MMFFHAISYFEVVLFCSLFALLKFEKIEMAVVSFCLLFPLLLFFCFLFQPITAPPTNPLPSQRQKPPLRHRRRPRRRRHPKRLPLPRQDEAKRHKQHEHPTGRGWPDPIYSRDNRLLDCELWTVVAGSIGT